jgi:hypothetical protein
LAGKNLSKCQGWRRLCTAGCQYAKSITKIVLINIDNSDIQRTPQDNIRPKKKELQVHSKVLNPNHYWKSKKIIPLNEWRKIAYSGKAKKDSLCPCHCLSIVSILMSCSLSLFSSCSHFHFLVPAFFLCP